MKKKIFIVLSSEYYYKYVSLKSFKDLVNEALETTTNKTTRQAAE